MKKLISILFIFVLLFYSFGYFLIFKSIQYSIRKEIKQITRQSVDVNDLECFEFEKTYLNSPDKDFKWIKKKEFRYKGKLYDILRAEENQYSVKMYCINDKDEELLVDNFLKFSNSIANTNIPQKQNKQIDLKLLKIIGLAYQQKENLIFNSKDILNFQIEDSFDDVFIKIQLPPPKSFS